MHTATTQAIPKVAKLLHTPHTKLIPSSPPKKKENNHNNKNTPHALKSPPQPFTSTLTIVGKSTLIVSRYVLLIVLKLN